MFFTLYVWKPFYDVRCVFPLLNLSLLLMFWFIRSRICLLILPGFGLAGFMSLQVRWLVIYIIYVLWINYVSAIILSFSLFVLYLVTTLTWKWSMFTISVLGISAFIFIPLELQHGGCKETVSINLINKLVSKRKHK